MKNTIKTLALFTTGLVVGVVAGRVKEKNIFAEPININHYLT